jgi:integrase
VASIQKLENTWRAFVCRKTPEGVLVRKSGTFDSKREAKVWADRVEAEIKQGVVGEIAKRTFGDLLQRYADEVSPTKRGARWELLRLASVCRDPVAEVLLIDLAEPDIAAWRDRRLRSVSAGSVRREWTLLSHACHLGVKEWKWLTKNPCTDVRRPAKAVARDRLFACTEIERLLVAFGWEDGESPVTVSARIGYAMLFSLETGLRCGELCALTLADVEGRVAVVRVGKTRAATRRVPLSPYALTVAEIVGAGREPDSLLFDLKPSQIDALFRKTRDRCELPDLHWHDLRHTAVTRLARKLDVLSLARMIGHSDLRQLQVYFNRSAEDIADDL